VVLSVLDFDFANLIFLNLFGLIGFFVKSKVRKVILVVCLVKSGGRHRFSFLFRVNIPRYLKLKTSFSFKHHRHFHLHLSAEIYF